MSRAGTFVRVALVAASLAATSPSTSVNGQDIFGSITGGIFVSDPSTGRGDVSGGGRIPHLGRTSLYGNVAYDVSDPLGTLAFGGQLRLTAANGDYVVANCGPTTIDETAGEFSWEVTFTGGTGRFEDATGTAMLVLHVLPDYWGEIGLYSGGWPGKFHLLDGTLNY